MGCSKLQNQLDDYLDRELPESELDEFDTHAESCDACRKVIARERDLRAALRGLPVDGPSQGFFDRALETAVQTGMWHKRPGLRIAGLGSAIAAGLALVFAVMIFVQR